MKGLVSTIDIRGQCEITTSQEFRDLYPNRKLPEFRWLKINGKTAIDDFSLDKEHNLIVSESAKAMLAKFKINNCDMKKYEGINKIEATV